MTAPPPVDSFAESYAAARRLFLQAAENAGAAVESHLSPAKGPDGGDLHCDIAWLGPADARRVLLVVSGTHGVEGYAGSACQVAFLRQPPVLPAQTAAVFAHAINPHGFAWNRRVTEDNVDLNRNFVDHADPPKNPLWWELADVLTPDIWDEHARKVMGVGIGLFIERHGKDAYLVAAAAGQYRNADALFYGGAGPVWSHELLRDFAARRLAEVRRLAVIDIHTGLGRRGEGELICRHPADGEAFARARAWYGAGVTSPDAGASVSPPIDGNLRQAFVRWLPRTEVTAVAIEFGTWPENRVFPALVAENWLTRKGDRASMKGRAIAAELRDAFYPDDDEWRRAVLARAAEVQAMALSGLDAQP